jgi:hypothetical protein
MGRGRQKAKATRVARDLKYSGPDMDLERLAKELHGEAPVTTTATDTSDEDPYEDDNYAKRA